MTIRTTVEVLGIIAFMATIGIFVTMDDANNFYTCEDTGDDRYCFDVRDYGDKIDYRCLYDESDLRKYYSCNSGWKSITVQEVQNLTPVIQSKSVFCEACYDGEYIYWGNKKVPRFNIDGKDRTEDPILLKQIVEIVNKEKTVNVSVNKEPLTNFSIEIYKDVFGGIK